MADVEKALAADDEDAAEEIMDKENTLSELDAMHDESTHPTYGPDELADPEGDEDGP